MKSPRRAGSRNSYSEQRPVPLLIDTDPGVDDAVALALAAASPELEVIAITTVAGNVDVARATRNARIVAARVGLHAPITAGAAAPLVRPPAASRNAHGAEGLGDVVPDRPLVAEPDRAAQRITALSREHDRLGVCALGPLTNLARALAQERSLVGRLGTALAMGGALGIRGSADRAAEFNWWSDPEAVQAVLAAGLDLRSIPLDTTRRVTLPARTIEALRRADDPQRRFWGDALGHRLDRARRANPDAGCPVHDAVAIALIVAPELATWRTMRLSIRTGDGADRGVVRESPDGVAIRAAVNVNAEEVVDLLRARLPWLNPSD